MIVLKVIKITDFKLTKDEETHASRLHEKAVVIDALQGVLAADPERYFPEFVEGGVRAYWGANIGYINVSWAPRAGSAFGVPFFGIARIKET